jgi:WD40 repeat protein
VSDRQFRAWSVSTGQEAAFDPWEVPSHDPQVSPDGRWRAECGGEGGGWGRPVRLMDTATGGEVASFETDPDVNIQEVRFSPGGERIIGGGWSESGEAMVWNVATGARLAWLHPFGSVFAIAVSFNRQVAATGSSGGEILLWNLDTGEQSVTLEGHEGSVEALAFSPDGRRLASASNDGTVRLWDLFRITPTPRLRDHPHGGGGIEFSEDGSRMLTSSGDETAWLWDARSGAPVACLNDQAMHYLEGGPPIPAVALRGNRVFSLLRGEIWESGSGATRARPTSVSGLWGWVAGTRSGHTTGGKSPRTALASTQLSP